MKANIVASCFVLLMLSSPAGVRGDEYSDLNTAAMKAILEGDYDLAIARCDRAVRIDVNAPGAYITRAWAYSEKGNYDKAITDCQTALTLNPVKKDEAQAYVNRGYAHQQKKNYEKAMSDFKKASQVDARLYDAYASMAWIWATCPDEKLRDGQKAWEYAKKAYELGADDASPMDVLAAAFAECGDFDQAIRWQEKAIQGTRKTSAEPDQDKRMPERLGLYKKKTPYRMK